jgi:hypothetical protein
MNIEVDSYSVNEEISGVYEPEFSVTIVTHKPVTERYPEVVKHSPFL